MNKKQINKLKKKLFLIISLFLIVILASQVRAVTNVSDCSTLNTAGTYYTLNASISNDTITTDCIIISAQNITLDCQGYSILSTQNYSGVYSNQRNTTIKNCNVSMGSGGNAQAMGIEYVSGANNGLIWGNNVSGGEEYGISIAGNYNNISNNLAVINYSGDIDGYAIHISGTYNNLTGNNGTNYANSAADSVRGISIAGTYNNLVNNYGYTYRGSGRAGGIIIIANNNTAIGNTGVSNLGTGFAVYDSQSNTLTNNRGISTSGYGIYLRTNAANSNFNTFINNTGSSNSSSGISAGGTLNNIFINNTGTSNSGFGISAGGTNYTWTGNTGTSNSSYALILNSIGSIFIGNSFIGYLSNSYGLGLYGASNNTIQDCINISGVSGDIDPYSGTSLNNTFINCSYNLSKENVGTGSLIRKWYYRSYVNDSSGTAVANANVSAYNVSGATEFSGLMTNSSGWTNVTTITEYVNTGGTRSYYNNYQINATYGTAVANVSNYNVTTQTNNLAHNIQFLNTSGVTSTCMNLTIAGLTYTLSSNVINNTITNDCIIVKAQNITLDCAGYSISSTQNYTGVYSNQVNTTVKNCNVSMGSGGNVGAIGIEYVSGANNGLIWGNNVSGDSGRGILLGQDCATTTGNNLTNNYATSISGRGIMLWDARNNTLTGNTGTSNSSYGIYIWWGCGNANLFNTLTNNIGISNSSNVAGIGTGNGAGSNTFIGNNGTNPLGYGIYIDRHNNNLTSNTGTSTSSYGIYLTGANNNSLTSNTGTSNSSSGIYIYSSSNNQIINNTGVTNYGGGIFVYSDNNTLTGNNGTSYGAQYYTGGINIRGSNNILTNNYAYSTNCGAGCGGVYYGGTTTNNNTFYNQTAIGIGANSAGIYGSGASNNTFINCLNISGTTSDVTGHGTNSYINSIFINCSYSISKESAGTGSSLVRKWYYRSYVNDSSGTAVTNANVSAYNVSGATEFSGLMTNSSGWTNITTITEYVNNGGTRSYYSNYTINASASGGYNVSSKSYNISVSLNNLGDVFTLTDITLPNATLLNPTNNTYISNNNINFTANITDNLGIKNVTLNIYNSTNSLVNQTTVSYSPGVVQTTIGIVVTLINGVYKWFYSIFDWGENNFVTQNYTLNVYVVSDCSNLTTAGAIYYLNQSVSNDTITTDCIIVSAANVTLDCAGYSISSTQNYSGVYSAQRNTTVKNCNISMGSGGNAGAIGIEFVSGANNGLIWNNNVSGNSGAGIQLTSATGNNLTGNNASSVDGYGIYLNTANNNTLTSNIGTSISSNGIYLNGASNNTLTSNIGTSNTGTDTGSIRIYLGSNNLLIGNNGTGNSTQGISIASSNNNLTNNIGISTSSTGINIYSSYNNNNLVNNTGISTSSTGISLSSNNNILTNNTGTSNIYYGFYLAGSNNILTGNIGSSNSTSIGIYCGGNNNTLINNTGTSNSNIGIYIYSATNSQLSNTIAIGYLSGSYGIQIYNSKNITIQDCINVSGVVKDVNYFNAAGSTNITFLNCSYDLSKETVQGAGNTLIRKWYYRSYVNDSSGTAVANANVSAYNVSGATEFSGLMTNGSGWTNITTITEYVNTGGTRSYYSNYTISVNNYTSPPYLISGQNFSRNITLSTNLLPDAITLNYDSTLPTINITNPLNNSYSNTDQNFTANLTDNYGLKNATLYIYNSTGIVNQTVFTSITNLLNSVVGVVVTLVDNVYTWFFEAFDLSGNKGISSNFTFTKDTTYPLINFTAGTPENNTGRSGEFSANISITELNIGNITWNWNGTISVFNASGTNLTNANNISIINITNTTGTDWIVLFNQSGLRAGSTYVYNVSVADLAGNSNYTETRTIKGAVAPSYVSINQAPLITDYDNLDPRLNVTVTANLSDIDNNFDSAILQWKNSTVNSTWNNVTMDVIGVKGVYTIVNHTFTLPSYESNITYRIWANDSVGENAYSNNYTILSFWDCTWNISSSDLGATAGWDMNKNIGNISINNTGDSAFSNNNCTLTFRLTHDLTAGRIYFDGSSLKPSNSFSVSAKNNRTVSVNATFLTEIRQENVIISINEVSSGSGTNISQTYEKNITATLVSNQAGPYLYQTVISYPTSVYLTPGNFSLQGYLRNLMGNSVVNPNNTAYNVSFYWTLPSGMTNVSGNLTANYTNITDNNLHYNNLDVSFSDLASMTSGAKTIYLYSLGYNLSGSLIIDANNNTLLTNAFNVSFLCYNVSDGVCVTSCGYTQDSDCSAPATTTTTITTSSGGGGGGTVTPKLEKSEATYELLNGKEEEFKLKIENKLSNAKKNIKISVTGIKSEYISIEPNSIDEIGAYSSREISVKINAPAYFTKGKYTLIFFIEGDIADKTAKNPFTEKKTVTLYIIELSHSDAEKYINYSLKLIENMKNSNMSLDEVEKLFNEEKDAYDKFDFSFVKNSYEKIKEIHDSAFSALDILNDLAEKIKEAEYRGISVLETKKILYVSQAAFLRGDYKNVLERLKEAQLTFALETKGEFSILYIIKNNPVKTGFGILGLIIFGFTTSFAVRLSLYKKKLKSLSEEEKLLLELMKVVQRECFENNHMSMEEYGQAMMQYEIKLSQTIEEKIRIEANLVNILKLHGRKNALLLEKERLIEMVKKVQDQYLNKAQIETRIYDNMIKTYSTKLAEVEEQITFYDAQEALGENKFSRRLLKAVKIK